MRGVLVVVSAIAPERLADSRVVMDGEKAANRGKMREMYHADGDRLGISLRKVNARLGI